MSPATGVTMADRLELHELMGRYGDAVDDRDWDALADIFTADAVFEVRGLVTMRGLDEIVTYMASDDAPHPLAHLMVNVHVAVADDGTVVLNSRAIFPVPGREERSTFRVVHGSYRDVVVKTPAGWRVRHRLFSSERPLPTD